MDKRTLPVDQDGNGARLRTLVYDEADAFMLMRALMLAANVAMMSGTKDAEARLRHYRAQFEEMAPPEARLLRRETDLSEIVIAMSSSKRWSLGLELPSWRGYGDRHAVVRIGDRSWSTRDTVDEETAERIAETLGRLAPVGCERVEHEIPTKE